MPLLNSDDIQAEFIDPLVKVVNSLRRNADRLRSAHLSGKLATGEVSLNVQMVKRAIGTLRVFRLDVAKKVEGKLSGGLKDREEEKRRKRARYAAEKLAEAAKQGLAEPVKRKTGPRKKTQN